MVMRVFALMCCVCFCSTGRADLINPNFDVSFLPNDNLDWESDESLLGLGVWAQTPGSLLAQPSAELSLFGSNGTVTLSQTFTPTGLNPGLVNGANLSWTHYLEADTPNAWSAAQQFRVLLSDQSANTLLAFTTSPGDPPVIGTLGTGTTGSANQAALVAFLNQLTFGEQITLSFEAFTTGTLAAAVDNVQFSFTLAAVPEPGAMAMTALSLGGLIVARRRRKAKDGSRK